MLENHLLWFDCFLCYLPQQNWETFLPSENIQHIQPKNIWEADKRNKLRSVFHGCFTFDLRAAYLFVIARVVRRLLLEIFLLDLHSRWSISFHFLLACNKCWNVFFLLLCHHQNYSYAVIKSLFYSLQVFISNHYFYLSDLAPLLYLCFSLCLSPPLLFSSLHLPRTTCKHIRMAVGWHVLFLFVIMFFWIFSFL